MNNDIFITNEVRDYIKEVNNAHKNNYIVKTEAMDLKLYISLCKFIEHIYIYDTIDKRNTLKNYIINMICSDKFDIETKQNNLNIFIEAISPIKDVNGVLKNIMLSISNNIYNILEKDNIEEQTTYINKLLGKYFNNNNDKNSDIELHNIIKKKLNNNKEDAELYLEFFKIIECTDEYCTNSKEITDYKKESGRFSLIRDDKTKHVKLLEIFNGKNVKILVSDEEIKNINKYKSNYDQFIENIMKPYYDEMVKIITSTWGWGIRENNNIIEQGGGNKIIIDSLYNIVKYNNTIVQIGGNKTIIDALYDAVKNIFKYFIKMSNEYGTNIYNFISSYFNGKDNSTNDTIKNKNSVLKVIGNTSDSYNSFIKTTLVASFGTFAVTALVGPDMITNAVGSIMDNIKSMISNITTSIKNYSINKILGEASDVRYGNKIDESIHNYAEDASIYIKDTFGINTELKDDDKLKFVTKKMLELSNDIKKSEFKNFYNFIVTAKIIKTETLNNAAINIVAELEYVKYFDMLVNIILNTNTNIIKYYEYIKKIFNIEPILESDIDKIKYMANEVITLTDNKKKEYIKTLTDSFKNFDIVPKFEDNDYIGKLQNIINKIENSNNVELIDKFIKYIKKNYKDISLENIEKLTQNKNIISKLNKQIIETYKNNEKQLRLMIADIKKNFNILPSLDTDSEKINNMMDQLNKIKEKKTKDFTEDIKHVLVENFKINTELNDVDKLNFANDEMFKLSDDIKKKEFLNFYNNFITINKIIAKLDNPLEENKYVDYFNSIIEITRKLKDIDIINNYYEYIKAVFKIDVKLESEYDQLKYMANNVMIEATKKKK